MPDGCVLDEYYVLEYPTWINVIAIDKEGQMILVRQYRHALGRTSFEIVAGVSEQGEDPMDAAKRELLEETGYARGEWRELMQKCIFFRHDIIHKLFYQNLLSVEWIIVIFAIFKTER